MLSPHVRDRPECTALMYCALCIYMFGVIVFLSACVPDSSVFMQMDSTIFFNHDNDQLCFAMWWVSFWIGVPSCVFLGILVCWVHVFYKPIVYNIVFFWLLLSVIWGNVILFYPDNWCHDKMLCLFTAALLFQNDVSLLLGLSAFVLHHVSNWRKLRAQLLHHHQNTVIAIPPG